MKIKSAITALTILLLLAFGRIASAGNIEGTVKDDSDAPVAMARVTLTELDISTVTDSEGVFMFRNVAHGTYHILVSLHGYRAKSEKIEVGAGRNEISITIERGLIETPTIDVTGTFGTTDISNSTYSVSSIGPRAISKKRGENIASTIDEIPGVSNFSTGNAIGKPVIRALTSQSILVVHDGIKNESQQWGDEHGPEISTFDIDRIDIVRGPASMIYGAYGIGGVVNIISKSLEYSQTDNPLTYGSIDLNGFSMNSEGAGNLMFGIGTKNFGIKSFAGYRKGGDINTPEGELTVQTPSGNRTLTGGLLFNSGTEEFNAGGKAGFKGEFGFVNLDFQNLTRQIQIHEDPQEEPDATPNQRIVTNHFEAKAGFNLSKKFQFEPLLSYEYNKRKEFESTEDKDAGLASLDLNLATLSGDLRISNNLSEKLSGAFGVSLSVMNNESLGEEKLIPNYDAYSFGAYFAQTFEEKLYTFSFGGRYDLKKENIKETVFEVDSTGTPTNVVAPNDLNFSSFSGSAGAVYKPAGYIDIYANIGTGWRPPSEFDLYADGVHEGTGRFDRGLLVNDPELEPEPERSFNIDFGARLRTKYLTAELSVFRNLINNYIYPSPTGETDPESKLPIYDIRQATSTFWGLEYSFQVQPAAWLLLTLNGDYVNARNDLTGNALPFTPPAKNILGLKLQKDNMGAIYNSYFEFTARFVAEQTQVDPLEAVTEGYTLLDAGVGFDFVLSKSIASVDLSVSNLADLKYVDHLSRYRYYAMNPGRSFNLKLTVPFQF